jgi:membrane protease subunit HflC
VAAASAIDVDAGQAVLVTQFGSPGRVLTRPGLYLAWPAPGRATSSIDTRLRITQGTLLDIVTSDGQHLQLQAYAAWRVPPDPAAIKTFALASNRGPETPDKFIRALLDSAILQTAPAYASSEFLNTNPQNLHLTDFTEKIRKIIETPAKTAFGAAILQTGIAQLTLPETTRAATLARMRAERAAQAAQRTAQAQTEAAEIRAEADRDSRITLADAQTEAAQIEAASRKQAAEIQARAYNEDPDLYLMLRSLDTLSTMVGPSTRLVLRTDAAPFNMLVQGPPLEASGK